MPDLELSHPMPDPDPVKVWTVGWNFLVLRPCYCIYPNDYTMSFGYVETSEGEEKNGLARIYEGPRAKVCL